MLFGCCFGNEMFFIVLYLISFSPAVEMSGFKEGSEGVISWGWAILQLARMNRLWVLASVCFPVMLAKQWINVMQLLNASMWLAEGDLAMRKKGRIGVSSGKKSC